MIGAEIQSDLIEILYTTLVYEIALIKRMTKVSYTLLYMYRYILIDDILSRTCSPAVDPIIIAPKGLSAKFAVQPMATPPEE